MRVTGLQAKTLIESYSEEKARALFARFVKNGTSQVPTLAILRAITFINEPEITADPRLKYVSPSVQSTWRRSLFGRPRSAAQQEAMTLTYQKNLEIVGAMRRAGVEILAGTDLGNPYVLPGFSLHDELALLVKAGLTPMEALQAATRNPARYLGRLDSTGTVEKGKLADLVLLDADPLADIANTQKIDSVILNGRLIPKAELQRMMAEVEAAANRK
jgi:imidazolonepropionase-like amidohydrolase